VLFAIQQTYPRPHPSTAVITLTDGVIYDMPVPQLVFNALRTEFCVFTYALAVAFSLLGTGDHPGSLGFLPSQLQIQTNQILFASEDDIYGASRAHLLTSSTTLPNPWQVVYNMTMQLSIEAQAALSGQSNMPCTGRVTYCNFIDKDLCTSSFSRRFCKWTVYQTVPWCTEVQTCAIYSQKACSRDKYCSWVANICQTNNAALPPPVVNHTIACSQYKTPGPCNSILHDHGYPSCYWLNVEGSPSCKSC